MRGVGLPVYFLYRGTCKTYTRRILLPTLVISNCYIGVKIFLHLTHLYEILTLKALEPIHRQKTVGDIVGKVG